LETEKKIYRLVIRTILTYSVEARADTSKAKHLLETAEMNTLRKAVGKT
jgi:hypothetical protein